MTESVQPDYAKIVGAHGRRRKGDYYPTPPEVTQALIQWLKLPSGTVIWEPAEGAGDMVRELRRCGYRVIGSDISTGTDFLTAPLPVGVEWIITNPPFSLSVEFINRCAEIGKPFALLLKSQYWHSASRRPLFNRTRPAAVLPLTWRPDFTGQGNSLMDMCWVVWSGGPVWVTQYQPLARPEKEEVNEA